MPVAQDVASPALQRLYGIRDRFAGGGSLQGILLVIVGIVTALILLQILLVVIHRIRRHRSNNPRRLFREVLNALPLELSGRDLLRRMAFDLRLSQPVLLLLSPDLFTRFANQWMTLARRANQQTREQLDQLVNILFACGPEQGARDLREDEAGESLAKPILPGGKR